MRSRHNRVSVFAIGLALCFAASAEAAQAVKKKSGRSAYAAESRQPGAGAGLESRTDPNAIYNGPDYIGTDPDPNIRAYIRKDLGTRYGGGGM